MAYQDAHTVRERMLAAAAQAGFTGNDLLKEAERLTAFVLDGVIPEEAAAKAEPAPRPDYGRDG